MLNKLLPRMSPYTKALLFTKSEAVKEVNNSGKEVVAANRILPKKAPETLVFLSNKSTKVDKNIDKNTTATATSRYEMIETGCCHILFSSFHI